MESAERLTRKMYGNMIRFSVEVSSSFPGVSENPDAKRRTIKGEKTTPATVMTVSRIVSNVSMAFANSHASFLLSLAR